LTLRISLLSKRISPHQMAGLFFKCKNGKHFAFYIFSILPNRCPLDISQERELNIIFCWCFMSSNGLKAPRGVPEISTPQLHLRQPDHLAPRALVYT
jgi:hypothetical protein